MERPSFVENGGFKLPIGYRFHPTDEELVVHYLKRKVLGLPMPASVIPEFDVFQNDPSSLPGNLKEKRYFFSQKKLNDLDLGKKCKRTAGSGASGYWKPIGKGKQIVASDSSKAVGTRKTLFFKERKHSIKTKSQWVMHVYCLAGSATAPKRPRWRRWEIGLPTVYFKGRGNLEKTWSFPILQTLTRLEMLRSLVLVLWIL